MNPFDNITTVIIVVETAISNVVEICLVSYRVTRAPPRHKVIPSDYSPALLEVACRASVLNKHNSTYCAVSKVSA